MSGRVGLSHFAAIRLILPREQRSADALSILKTAVNDPIPAVWKEALDGLVVLGSPEARRILLSVRSVRPDRETGGSFTFDEWIADAIEQIDAASD